MIGILDSTQHPLPQGILLLMEEILHQLRLIVFTILYRVFYIPGGAGFLPSTVGIYAYMFQEGLAKGTIIRCFSGSSHPIPNAAAIATAVFYGASAAMAAASAQAGQANLKQGEPQWQQRCQLKASCFKTLRDEDF